jgi:hypothetical protein
VDIVKTKRFAKGAILIYHQLRDHYSKEIL